MLPNIGSISGAGQNGSRKRSMESNSMTVTLISQTGSIQTIWLPETMEGRYRFSRELDTVPVYVDAVDHSWVAHSRSCINIIFS